jgi:hypothetical protein
MLDDHMSFCLNRDIKRYKIVNRTYHHWLGNKQDPRTIWCTMRGWQNQEARHAEAGAFDSVTGTAKQTKVRQIDTWHHAMQRLVAWQEGWPVAVSPTHIDSLLLNKASNGRWRLPIRHCGLWIDLPLTTARTLHAIARNAIPPSHLLERSIPCSCRYRCMNIPQMSKLLLNQATWEM